MELQTFTAPTGSNIRAFLLNGEPHFFAADICRALEIQNPTDALERLDPDEHTLVSTEGIPGARNPQARAVSEPGLYALIMGSRKPEAKAFRRWVTHDVLPSIRKTGGYQLAPVSRLDLARMLLEAEEKAEARERALEAAQPAIEFHELVAKAEGEFGITEAALEIGVKVPEFVQGLLDRGYVLRRGKHGAGKKGKLEPAHYPVRMGYMRTRMTVVGGVAYPEAVFLPRGIQWAAKLFKAAA